MKFLQLINTKKNLRLVVKLFGISLAVLGLNSSCKKDTNDCFNCTYVYAGQSIDIEFCEDDLNWEYNFDSWEEASDYYKAKFNASDEYDC